ncbi:hypothetical protein, partial [Hornefia butyriciproducens]|uniref:hypothetical protein n=1 Tax=Hornefia butyriciproducens TaxID=2652293 RepID=UPI003F8969AD
AIAIITMLSLFVMVMGSPFLTLSLDLGFLPYRILTSQTQTRFHGGYSYRICPSFLNTFIKDTVPASSTAVSTGVTSRVSSVIKV